MLIKYIKLNKANPRFIKDEKFKKLLKSIKEMPKMMALRPIVIDNDGTILGGNMRFRALIELGYKEIPDTWVKKASELTDEEKQRFIIVDNNSFGEYDWDMLANEWDTDKLVEWGVDLPNWDNEEPKDLSNDLKETFEVIVSCADEAHQEQIYNKLIEEGLECRVLTL